MWKSDSVFSASEQSFDPVMEVFPNAGYTTAEREPFPQDGAVADAQAVGIFHRAYAGQNICFIDDFQMILIVTFHEKSFPFRAMDAVHNIVVPVKEEQQVALAEIRLRRKGRHNDEIHSVFNERFHAFSADSDFDRALLLYALAYVFKKNTVGNAQHGFS